MRSSLASIFRLLLASGLPALTIAQTTAAPPDWTGFYTLVRGGKDLAGYQSVSPDLDKVIIAHLQPWARLKLEATDGVADDTGGLCRPDGIFRFPPFAGRFLWLHGTDKLVQVFHEINTAGVRRMYLNRQHPKNLLPTWNGDSIARWEGDTLLVDTIGFNDKSWLMSGMEPHTEETHLTERIRVVANGALMEITSVVEDRHALTSAYTYRRYYKKQDTEMEENVCNDDLTLWKKWRDEHLKPQLERAKQVK
jgi:hypothetical protein